MKVLQLADFYPPAPGGLELHVQALSHELARRGHDVAVGVPAQPGEATWHEDRGVRVRRLRAAFPHVTGAHSERSHAFHPPAPDPVLTASIGRWVAEARPDIVHLHGWIAHSYLALPRRRRLGRTVATLHDYGATCAKKTFYRGGQECDGAAFFKCIACSSGQYGRLRAPLITTSLFASRPLRNRVDRWLAVSSSVADVNGARLGGSIHVVPNFYRDREVVRYQSARPPSYLPDGPFVLFVGALMPHKGVTVLLQAAERMGARVPIVFLGSPGNDTPSRFPENTIVRHAAPHEEVIAAMAAASVVVIPSVWPEPFATVALEAMACAAPIVATEVGGLRDLFRDGENAVLCPPGDAAALAEALDMLLHDRVRAEKLGRIARADSHQYACSVVAEQIEREYERLMQAESPRTVSEGHARERGEHVRA